MEKILRKEDLGAWVAKLDSWAIYAPAFDDGVWNYRRVDDASAVQLDHGNTVKPPKEFTFPQREVLYRFEQAKGAAPILTGTVPNPAPIVVLGVRPCDGRAMPRNDKVFVGEFADPYYGARRKGVAFVGLACNAPPSPNCFCQSVGGSPHSEEGLDILLTELKDRYHVKVVTARGRELTEHAGNLFAAADAEDKKELGRIHGEASRHHQRQVGNLGTVAEALRRHFDSPHWAEMAKACIGCGICTFLCPTCHCFDINDEVTGQSPCRGQRIRTWDTCQFPDFTMHSSGHNPRPDTASRLRQRVCHKFLYFVDNHKIQQCTGCGRCISECPVGVDIVAVLERVSRP